MTTVWYLNDELDNTCQSQNDRSNRFQTKVHIMNIYPDKLRGILLAGLLLITPVVGLAGNYSPANDLTKQCASALIGDIDASKPGNDPKRSHT